MKIPNMYLSAPPFGGCSQTCSSIPCVCVNVQFETQTAQTCIFMDGPLFSVGLGPPRPRPPFPFLFSWRLTCLGPPGIFVGPSPWSKMTRVADIQWLPRFITDVYSVRLGRIASFRREQGPERLQGSPRTEEGRSSVGAEALPRRDGTLASRSPQPDAGAGPGHPETASPPASLLPASALQAYRGTVSQQKTQLEL